ncbi:MAG TPA: hypothetical protein VFA70_12265 [Dehalococcoidia bacterium]|nr:hypothetical protein [Dehalococcoidia bacterium]
MEQDYGLDLDEVNHVIDTADVVIVRFKLIEQRLLIDARHDAEDGPLVTLVGRAASVEDRFHSLKALRPRFPLPDKIMSFEWVRKIQTMAEAGLWGRIEARLLESGGERALQQARAAFDELKKAERREEIAAIRGGDGYQTLWERAH